MSMHRKEEKEGNDDDDVKWGTGEDKGETLRKIVR